MSAVTPVFNDGFESGTLSQWSETSSISDQQKVVYAGSWAARATTNGDTSAYTYPSLAFDNQTVFAGHGKPDKTPPSVPANLVTSGATQSSITLSWSASTDNVAVAGYDLWANGVKTGTATGTSYTFSGLACGQRYTLGVDAFDAARNTSAPRSVTASTGACPTGGANAFYVSPTGLDSNPGTINLPWKTIGKAMSTLTAGQTAYLLAGVYSEQSSGSCSTRYNKLIWTTSGTSSAPITISGYPGKKNQVIVKTAVRLAGNYQRLQNMVVDKNLGYSTFDLVCNGAPNVQLYGHNDTIRGLEVHNSTMSGVYLDGADGATVAGNWIHGNGTHSNLDHGIYWFSGANSRLESNIVQNNLANGIKIGPNAQSVLVTENTVVANGRSGVIVCGDTTYVARNNTVADNILVGNGTSSTGGNGLRTYWELAGVGTGNTAYSNVIYGNRSGAMYLPGGGLTAIGSILQDPLFVNQSAGDFHLLSGSPAVNTANPAYAAATDYDGTPRPQGGGPDIGAYER